MNILFLYTGSPLYARKSFSYKGLIVAFVLIIILIFLLWFISKKILSYKKSEKYINKEKNRPSKYKEITDFCKNNNLIKTDINLLWEILNITKTPNIFYNLTTSKSVIDIFHKAYIYYKQEGITDEKLNHFFNLEYKLENIMAKKTGLLSTKGIPANNIIFYLSESGEQSPFNMEKNTNDGFFLEIPEHIFNSPNKPKNYIRQKFVYKTNDGTIYNFVTRIIRYEADKERQKFFMVIAHTDKLESEVQRQSKREFYYSDCLISPVKEETLNTEKKYTVSDKQHKCHITNISAGGCCIQTDIPIKEKQILGIQLSGMNITERIIGIIRHTRRLQTGEFALHIQFLEISTHTQNEILTRIYKYEL